MRIRLRKSVCLQVNAAVFASAGFGDVVVEETLAHGLGVGAVPNSGDVHYKDNSFLAIYPQTI